MPSLQEKQAFECDLEHQVEKFVRIELVRLGFPINPATAQLDPAFISAAKIVALEDQAKRQSRPPRKSLSLTASDPDHADASVNPSTICTSPTFRNPGHRISFETASGNKSSGRASERAACSASYLSDMEADARKSRTTMESGSLRASSRINYHPMQELLPVVLDKAEMHRARESIWDLALFLWTPSLGNAVSCVIAVVFILNILMQVWFCMIIWQHMIDSPAEPEILDGLLRFRASIAHNVEYADNRHMRSLASQLCDGDHKLHLSGRQFEIKRDMDNFKDNALPLSLLTTLCWILHVIGETFDTAHFLRAVWTVHRSTATRIVTDAECQPRPTFSGLDEAQASLIRISVVVRLASMSWARAMCTSMFVVLPRLLISLSLGLTGISFLTITSNMEDLLLNGMALAFIATIDELLYDVCTPRRARTLIEELEPLPATFTVWKDLRLGWLTALIKIGLVAVILLVVKLAWLDPFYHSLKQATDILCSGVKNFVVAESTATGMVHVCKTQQQDGWSSADKAVLQLAQFNVQDGAGWRVDPQVRGFGDIVAPVVVPMAPSLGAADVSSSAFRFVSRLTSMTAEESDFLLCEDGSAGQTNISFQRQLRKLLANSSIHSCSDIRYLDAPLCSRMNMTQLRALCPDACGCTDLIPGRAGFFAHVSWGCPSACSATLSFVSGLEAKANIIRSCEDIPPPVFFLSKPIVDLEFMLNRSISMSAFFTNYINGLFEYLSAQQGFKAKVFQRVAFAFHGVLTPTLQEQLSSHIVSGEMKKTILSGTWELMPGLPHPRGLEGCEYLMSFEIIGILELNLCEGVAGYSLRRICPTTCGCGSMNGCPYVCKTPQAFQSPCSDMAHDGTFLVAIVHVLEWVVNESNAVNCSSRPDVIRSLCGENTQRGLVARRLCPTTCECAVPLSSVIGFYGMWKFGCPQLCRNELAANIRWLTSAQTRPSCVDADPTSMLHRKGFFVKWIRGFSNWSVTQKMPESQMLANLRRLSSLNPVFRPSPSTLQIYFNYIMNGGMVDTILNGSWELMPGIPHPRGLTGCAYMASPEFSILLAVDVCSTHSFTSLRYLCPISCQCGAGMFECPGACSNR